MTVIGARREPFYPARYNWKLWNCIMYFGERNKWLYCAAHYNYQATSVVRLDSKFQHRPTDVGY